MSSFNAAFGGFGYDHGSKRSFMPGNMFESRPAFGHSNQSGYDLLDPGISVPAFGHDGYYNYPYVYAPASAGTSLSPFRYSFPFGFNPAAIGHTSHPFGYHLSSGGSAAPSFGHNSHPFGFTPTSGGTSAPALGHSHSFGFSHGGRQNSTPFGSAPANGETSVPTFGKSSNSLGFTPSNGGTSMPTFGQNSTTPFGSAPANGGTSIPRFGQISTPFGFGCASANGGTSVAAFGPSTNSSGFIPSNTTTSVPSWQRSNPLGSVPNNGKTPETTFGEGRTYFAPAPTPTDGGTSVPSGPNSLYQTPAANASSSPGCSFGWATTCSQPTLPAGSSLFGTGSHLSETPNHLPGSTTHVQTPLMNGTSSGFGFGCTTSGQVTPQLSTSSNLFGTSTCFGGIQVPFSGEQVKTPLSGGLSSESFSFSVNRGGTRATRYTETVELEANSQLSTRLMSISAMPVFRNRCHEELRWEDKQLGDNGGGVDPASEQLKCFRTPVSSTGSSFLNAVNSFVAPDLFASSTPCFTFPTCSNPFVSNSSLNNPHGGAYTSITQPHSLFCPSITFSHPNSSYMSASEASTSAPSLFNYTSPAPCASICSTSVTTPVTASVPCSSPSYISTLHAEFPSRCRVEMPPEVPQMSAKGPKTTSQVEHLANEKQKQLLTPKCNEDDGLKVSFSADAHETPTTARKRVPFLPKHNSGVLISGPSEQWSLRIDFENISHIKHTSIHVYDNGKVSVELSKPLTDGSTQDKVGNPGENFAAEPPSLEPDSVNGNHPFEKEVSSDVYGLLPKLKDSDYFIQPRFEELAIKESFEPGFCSHVKDFVVGHQRYGHIKFLGETDVRQLDVNSHIVFRNREVILSMDEHRKPPLGQGLNKAAEITLCNIKCIDKAGNQHINGPKVDKYRKKLMKKAAEQGAEFVSYDPVQGEWKFRVEHF